MRGGGKLNAYEPEPAIVTALDKLSSDSLLIRLKLKNPDARRDFRFHPGQFIEVGLLGYGEIPVGIASSPGDTSHIDVSVRDVGNVSGALHRLELDDEVGVRGPFGNGFADDLILDKNVLLIGGGCGIPPLRSLALYIMEKRSKFKDVTLLYGSRSHQDLLFRKEYDKWKDKIDIRLTVDTEEGWDDKISNCQVGVVTNLLDKGLVKDDTVAALCGPPIMYKFVCKKLMDLGMPAENILVSLERRMKCGVGKCQHCSSGSKYVCLDGPVFTYRQIIDDYGGL
ncbi:FAD/NAD(P)-binding protein [Candidatus Altiarchaeota archaeon]